jgi:ubiquinone/menaquinone biosynthesis C-methylase UbiE
LVTACALPYAGASFDRTLSLLVLHFVPNAERAVGEMKRVTRPGGLVAAAVWDSYGGMPNQRMFWDSAAAIYPSAAQVRVSGYWKPMVRPGELAAAFRKAGICNVEEQELHIRMVFPTSMTSGRQSRQGRVLWVSTSPHCHPKKRLD